MLSRSPHLAYPCHELLVEFGLLLVLLLILVLLIASLSLLLFLGLGLLVLVLVLACLFLLLLARLLLVLLQTCPPPVIAAQHNTDIWQQSDGNVIPETGRSIGPVDRICPVSLALNDAQAPLPGMVLHQCSV